MSDLWNLLYEGLLTSVFGSPLALGLFLLVIIGIFGFIVGQNKVLLFPMLLFAGYGFYKFGMLPVQVYGILVLLVGIIFAYTVYNLLSEMMGV